MANPVFQLSMLSQDDQENSICPGCPEGKELWGIVENFEGMKFLGKGNNSPYPSSDFPLREWVRLPWPKSELATPTWFFEVTGPLHEAWIQAFLYTPDHGTTRIRFSLADIPGWVAISKKYGPINQIYKNGNCGIIGYAQENQANGLDYQIYTVTGGICNPQIHG